ncbi:PRADC1-like protein [Haliotis cracherodii]|uniref:PRADC1-like protein n=1 Tax=Haliotis cracherodii TaxID=6455 RepID=UPI0039E88767
MERAFLLRHIFLLLLIFWALLSLCELDLQLATSPDVNLVLNDAMFFEIIDPEQLSYTYKLRPARDFGGVFEHTLNKVELRFADPLDGCGTFTSSMRGSIAFILRGGCSFLTKTYNAEMANAFGAIISDSDEENDDKFVDMIDDNTSRKVNIPAMFLMGKDGAMIRHTLQQLNMDSALINIPINVTGIPLGRVNQPPWTLW